MQVLDDHIWVLGIYSQINGLLLKLCSVLLYTLSLPLLVIVPLNPPIFFKANRVNFLLEEVF
jgi:hypothetical protein